VQAFQEKLANDYHQEVVIRAITSFSLAHIKVEGDFWLDIFETIAEKVRPESLDPFLKMNLLWSMARNHGNLHP
jgi:hypothetical protein